MTNMPKTLLFSSEGKEMEDGVFPRPVWTGSMSLGLVIIPFRAVPMTRVSGCVHFRMIHKVCNITITYCKVCLAWGGEPSWRLERLPSARVTLRSRERTVIIPLLQRCIGGHGPQAPSDEILDPGDSLPSLSGPLEPL
jgi:hypothetical protein